MVPSRSAGKQVGLGLAAALFGVGICTPSLGAPPPATELRSAITQTRALAARAFAEIKAARIARGIPIDERVDPTRSGLIGVRRSPATTVHGKLSAKQKTLNPAFIDLVVELLWKAGVRRGDVVAGNLSGSFPVLNVAVLCAMQVLGAESAMISSVGASQWGANAPKLLWSDIESLLVARRIITLRSVAMTLGGTNDRAEALTRAGRKMLRMSIRRSGVPLLSVESFMDSVRKRMAAHQRAAGKKKIKAYVNVGGNTVSVGGTEGKHAFRVGLNLRPPKALPAGESMITNFARRGVPIVHLVYIDKLMARYRKIFERAGKDVRPPSPKGARGMAQSRGSATPN